MSTRILSLHSAGAPPRVLTVGREEEYVATEHEQIVKLRDGAQVLVRPIRADDKQALVKALDRLSPESRYRRFLRPVNRLSERELRYLTEIDYTSHFAWIATDLDDESGLGVARYVRDSNEPEVAEAAVAIVDDYQGKGLGTILIRLLVATALENEIKVFRSWVLGENRQVLGPLERVGARRTPDEGVLKAEVSLEEVFDGSSVQETLRAAATGEF